ncbi:DNA helicase [Streptomyces phage Sycamore]|uniref:DNA helicase n=1 Tax=Streptomyces phage Sycamore TaxID=2767589 RepID=A0A873WNC2_9CAUD|nr:DNA helicase [Streptomyces phage Sycamore]
MSAKVTTIQRGGSRFYVNPETHEKVPGVTSVVGMLPKPFLTFWAAKMTAEAAVDNLRAVESIAANDRDGAVDYLKGAHRRYTKLRAGIGSDAHDMFERLIRGEYIRRAHPDLEPYRVNFLEFLEKVQPELIRAEDVAWSDTHKYAGSFDALLSVKDEDGTKLTVLADWKTSKATYPDVALQMAAYGFADRLIDPEGNSEPMPQIDTAAVLHITPEQWAFKPVRFDDEVFSHFLTLRKTFDWDREVSKTVIGKPFANGGPKGYGALVTGTQRRAR